MVLASIVAWGLEAGALEKFIGMFSFALWDKKNKKCFLSEIGLRKASLLWLSEGGPRFLAQNYEHSKKHPSFNAEIDKRH